MKKCLPYILVIIAIALIIHSVNNEQVVIEKHTTDTITVCKVDTIFYDRPTFVTEVVKDTIVIYKVPQNGLKLPLTQKYYSDEDYEAWVSGYLPALDSINVYQKTLTNTIVKEYTKCVYPKTTDLYLNVGGNMINGEFSPHVGVSVKFKNDLSVGANVGYFDKSVYYGVSFGFKINK